MPSENIRICKYIQGENDAELFAKIGKWCVSPYVHKRLGIAVTAMPGDVWYIAESGFLQLRTSKNGKVHIRFLFTNKKFDEETEIALLKTALADYDHSPIVFTNDRKNVTVWKKFSFEQIEKKRGGEFCRWEKKNS